MAAQVQASGIDEQQLDTLQRILADADVEINGSDPWDPQVRDQRAFDAVMRRGSLGAGEAYMSGWWDAAALDQFFFRILRARLAKRLPRLELVKLAARAWIRNPQGRSRVFDVAHAHYNLGEDLFAAMLDRRLTYSCGYWQHASDLDTAQEHKLDLVCRKLGLKPGQRVLDIGCGWGSFCKFAAERYGAELTGITISEQQIARGKALCRGLPIELRLEDYRDTTGQFDHIVSIGMIEHVGVRNYPALFDTVDRCLAPDGLFLLHTIGGNLTARTTDPWIDRYIFPNGQLPSLRQLAEAAEGSFVLEDLHNFGAHYDKTLLAWFEKFDRAWPELQARYDETFYRMWKYYLLQSAGAFRARDVQLWQLVYSRNGVLGGYRRPERAG